MRLVTARDAARGFGDLIDGAAREPVTIVRRGRSVAVMMDFGLYEAFRKAYDAEQDQRMIAQIEQSCDRLLKGGFDDSERVRALSNRLREGVEREERK